MVILVVLELLSFLLLLLEVLQVLIGAGGVGGAGKRIRLTKKTPVIFFCLDLDQGSEAFDGGNDFSHIRVQARKRLVGEEVIGSAERQSRFHQIGVG